MVFATIARHPSLTTEEHARAAEAGPTHAEAIPDYPTLLRQTGWLLEECVDLTLTYLATAERGLRQWQVGGDRIAALLGRASYTERLADKHAKVEAIGDGLLRRELYFAEAGESHA